MHRIFVIVTGLAVLLMGVLFFLNIRALRQLHSAVRRGEQARGEEWNNKWRDYTNQEAQGIASLHAQQELERQRVEKYNQQQQQIMQQQLDRMGQLGEESLRLSRQAAGLPRNSRAYQETAGRIQAVNAERAKLQRAQQTKNDRDYRILELTEEASGLQMKFITGLGRRPASQEYQDASNRLNTLRAEFLKLADPARGELARDHFRIPGTQPPSSNQVARADALLEATQKAGAQSARIRELNAEIRARERRIFKSGAGFASTIVAFIVVLVARPKNKTLLHNQQL